MGITMDILNTDLKGFTLSNPILMASGTCGYNDEYDCFFDISNVGAIVTKAITLYPRVGNRHTRIIETKAGMINSIGLENVGIDKFLSEKLPILQSKHINFIMNVAGSTLNEYIELSKICENNKIKAIELNVSCPNVKSGCLEFGVNPNSLYELVSSVREQYNGFLIVKLTPNVTSIEEIGLAAQKAGANAVSAINTLKGSAIKIERFGNIFKKTVVSGGYSGVGIKPVALGAVLRLSKVLDIPIIGIGGIETLNDVLEFFIAGAEAVQIGTANFTHPNTVQKIIDELSNYIKDNCFKDLNDLKKGLRA